MIYDTMPAYRDEITKAKYTSLLGGSRIPVVDPKAFLTDPKADYKLVKVWPIDEERYHPWALAHTNVESDIAINPPEKIPYEFGPDSVLRHEREHILNPDEPSERKIDLLGGRRERDDIRSRNIRLY